MPALLSRFENETLRLWEKHGIRQAGFWTTLVGESNQELTYLLAWESLADRDKKWNAFQADPEWQAKRAESDDGDDAQCEGGRHRHSGSRAGSVSGGFAPLMAR